MARADYICCDKCGCKLIYDGNNTVIDMLDWLLTGQHSDTENLVDVWCQDCSGVGGILIKAKPGEELGDE